MDKNLRNLMYDLRAILKRLQLPISKTLAGRSFHLRRILTKKAYFITIAVRRFNLHFVVVIGPGTF